jgi:hypothetical protein
MMNITPLYWGVKEDVGRQYENLVSGKCKKCQAAVLEW